MTILSLTRSTCVQPFGLKTRILGRCLSTRASPVDLAYDVHNGPINPQAEQGPLILAHGLFGSKRNWTSTCKAFARELKRPIISLDLRNFGESPQSEEMDYRTMASDIIQFCNKHSLKNVSLLGHSMGGKVAMAVALDPDCPKDLLRHLIVADIAPVPGRLTSEFPRYMEAMLKIQNEGKVKSRKEAFDALYEYENDTLIRHFLLTNLASTPEGEPVKFRTPLDIINRNFGNIGDFPYEPGKVSWDGPTLFIKGSKSRYIQDKHYDTMTSFFPHMEIRSLDAGHWVHYEQASEFIKNITQFILQNQTSTPKK
ncbi:alpha beta-hydrolase [Pyrrhoderma noxium]|uniref:Alpha beta-hydrolase n=1 Tax=Pyrrhoderma noxium TaxID=2282107 RepID=A0A286UA37_9AGAM|nr:alpha beta-hydrolase [Pyrrhoderma noxium]